MKKWKDTLPETPSAFHNRVEMTLAGLEEREMKKSAVRTPVLVLAILIVTIAATAFAATAVIGGHVDWNGNFTAIDENAEVMPTIAPYEVEEFNVTDLLGDVPEGEYWEAWQDGSGSGVYGYLGQQITDEEEFREKLSEAGIVAPGVPAGWKLAMMELNFQTLDIEREKYSEELINGVTLIKYRLTEPVTNHIHGYYATYVDDNGTYIRLDMSRYERALYEEEIIGDFYVEPGEEYETFETPVMDRALVITRTDGSRDIRMERDVDENTVESYYIYVDAECSLTEAEIAELLFK